ncbi:hypothetical protein V5O48_017067 [Marasmius crinis-equi]|uniref:Uncharacterized protein n=1 Tax=Marasmius crinis-equi TaxID=585013 RepID=A0ABR3EQ89_9AGAR
MIPILTRRYLLSPNPDNALKDQSFRRPQERGTVMKDSDCIARLLAFLIRTDKKPVANFAVILHPNTLSLSLLSEPSDEFKRNELISGLFETPNHITPTIARAQWCFRASSSQQLVTIEDEFEGDTHRAYEERIKTYITDKHHVLFTTLRQQMKYFSALPYTQKGVGRLHFTVDKSVISFDGFPIRVQDLGEGVTASIAALWVTMERIYRGCRFDDVLGLIDEAMNPDPAKKSKWWKDVLQNRTVGYCLMQEPDNDLLPVRPRLKNHLAQDERMFSVVDGELCPNAGECFEWLALVKNDVTRELFALLMATMGGGARGTEFEKLLYANSPRHTRNIFFINGFLTIITEYIKTQSMTGHGKTIARVAALAVYYAAGYVCMALGMPKEDCERYFYEVFVISGKSMTSEKFSASLGTWNSTHLGIELKLRDFRQLMSCLLITFTNSSFDRDDEDVATVAAHESFGHSVEVGQQYYGLEICNGGTTIASDSMVRMQRVSLRWHSNIGHLPRTLQKRVKTGSNGLPTAESSKELAAVLKSTLDTFRSHMKEDWVDFKQETKAFIRSEFETLGTT